MPDAKLILGNGDSVFAGMGVANVERVRFGATAVIHYFFENVSGIIRLEFKTRLKIRIVKVGSQKVYYNTYRPTGYRYPRVT